jgi:hypothetical protein
MQAVTTIGLEIAKSVFQVHGVDAEGKAVIQRQLKRRYVLAFFQKLPSCLVGIEACASSHHWSRELQEREHRPSPTGTPGRAYTKSLRSYPLAERDSLFAETEQRGRASACACARIQYSPACVTLQAQAVALPWAV